MPRALITGITGQDGQHLAEFLHRKGYEVFGMVKGQNNPKAADGERARCRTSSSVPGDLADLPSLVAALEYDAARRGVQPRRDLVRRPLASTRPS